MEITESKVKELNELSDKLSRELDTVVYKFVDKLSDENDLATPFIVLGALSNIMTKLLLLMGEKRQSMLDILNEMLPTDEMLEVLKKEENNNVIPLH